MRLVPSWSSYFTAFGDNDAANANMALFGDAMEAQKSKIEKINDLVEDKDTVALIKGKDGKVKALHNFKKVGGTRIRPEMELLCLLGLGARAIGIVVDPESITESKEITVPTADYLTTPSPLQRHPSADQFVGVKTQMLYQTPWRR